MSDVTIHIRIKEDLYRKFKVFCAINNQTITGQASIVIKKFVDEQSETIKIINTKKEK